MLNFNEPIYDDDQLAQIETHQTEQLVGELVDCIANLCKIAANLRTEVNELTQKFNLNTSPVYYEVYSDLCKSFENHPAYNRFVLQLSKLIHE